MKSITHIWLILGLLTMLVSITLVSPAPALAASCQWTGAADTAWSNAGNWITCDGTAPDSGDTATIPNVTNDPVVSTNESIAGLTIDSGGELTVGTGSTLTINGPVALAGTVTGGGDLTVAGLLTWSGGKMSGTGTVTAGGGLLESTSSKSLDTRSLTVPVGQTASWTDGTIALWNGPTITNNGTWDVQTDEDIHRISGAYGTFNNVGTLQKAAGSDVTAVEMNVNNSGTVAIHSGLFGLTQDLTNSIGGVVDIDLGSELTVDGTLSNSGTFAQTQSVDGSAAVDFLRITDSSGSTVKYRGVIIDTSGTNMGDTTVSVDGYQTCGPTGTVQRCFEIDPASPQNATLTFFYLDSEANGNAVPVVYHLEGSTWIEESFDARDTSGDPNWVRATGIDTYSAFALADSQPTAVALHSFATDPSSTRGVKIFSVVVLVSVFVAAFLSVVTIPLPLKSQSQDWRDW